MINFSKESCEERFSFYTSGALFMSYKFEKLCIALSLLPFLSAVIKGFYGVAYMIYKDIIVAAVVIFLLLTLLNTLVYGAKYNYEADESSFTLKRKDKSYEFFYKDVVSVDYKQWKIPLVYTRLYVKITTKYRTTRFTYIYPNVILDKVPKNTPFHIIEERAGLIKDTD